MLRSLVFGLAAIAAPVLAQDHPLIGFFRHFEDADPLVPETDDLACAMSFFLQDANGAWVEYTADRTRFSEMGGVRHVQIGTIRCNDDRMSKSEVCQRTSHGDDDAVSGA